MVTPARGITDAGRALEAVAAEHGARIVATLIRACGGDFQLAEDALQEALITALERWPHDVVPAKPDAWLYAAARRKTIDQLRRSQNLARKTEQIQNFVDPEQAGEPDEPEEELLQDDRLRLIFTCCHPSLALEAQVALTLRTVAG